MSKVTYVGLDVHKRSIVVVAGRKNERERAWSVANTREGWAELVERIGREKVWAVYEASSCGFGLYDYLVEQGGKVTVVAPTHVARSVMAKKRKTDLEDAKRLRELVMAHAELGTKLPAVWVPDQELREDRESIRRRLEIGERIAAIKTRIGNLLMRYDVPAPEDVKTRWTSKYQEWLREVSRGQSESVGATLRSYLRELEYLLGEREEVEKDLERVIQKPCYRDQVKRLMERPGVGPITAATYVLELGDPNRFENRRQLAAYLGLVPTCYESGEATDRKGHITRMGPWRIRKVLNQAAWACIRGNAHWKEWYQTLSKRRGRKKAIVALMRKLGIQMWHDSLAA